MTRDELIEKIEQEMLHNGITQTYVCVISTTPTRTMFMGTELSNCFLVNQEEIPVDLPVYSPAQYNKEVLEYGVKPLMFKNEESVEKAIAHYNEVMQFWVMTKKEIIHLQIEISPLHKRAIKLI